jgi:hypothetical protein
MSALDSPHDQEQPRAELDPTKEFTPSLHIPGTHVYLRVPTEESFLGDSTDLTSDVSGKDSLTSRLSSPVQLRTDSRRPLTLPDSYEKNFQALSLEGAEFPSAESVTQLGSRAELEGLREWLEHNVPPRLLRLDVTTVPVAWNSTDILSQSYLYPQSQASCIDTSCVAHDDRSSDQPKRKKPRPRNEKRKEKDKERLRQRINRRMEEASDAATPEEVLYSVEGHTPDDDPYLHAPLFKTSSSQHHLGRIPSWLRDSTLATVGTTSATLDDKTDFERYDKDIKEFGRLLRRDTWNYTLGQGHTEMTLQASESFYRSPSERLIAMVPKRRTEPQDQLTRERDQLQMTQENAVIDPEFARALVQFYQRSSDR